MNVSRVCAGLLLIAAGPLSVVILMSGKAPSSFDGPIIAVLIASAITAVVSAILHRTLKDALKANTASLFISELLILGVLVFCACFTGPIRDRPLSRAVLPLALLFVIPQSIPLVLCVSCGVGMIVLRDVGDRPPGQSEKTTQLNLAKQLVDDANVRPDATHAKKDATHAKKQEDRHSCLS